MSPRLLLEFAGRNGPLMLFTGVFVGLMVPALAEAARPWLGVAVFVFTLGAFLKVDLPTFRREMAAPAWIAVLVWTTFGVPLTMGAFLHMFVHLLKPNAALSQALMLCMLAPPVGSAAAIAAMLGLSAPLSLLATVFATVLSPLYLPPLAKLAGYQLEIDPAAMALRLVLIVGGACIAAAILRRYAGKFVAHNPHAMTGVAVLGLILVAMGAMRGMQTYFLEHPLKVIRYLVIAFSVNAGFQILGAGLFWHLGRTRALTVGLLSGNRNVTLIWAAASTSLMGNQEVELYLAMSVFPIFMLPVMTRWALARMLSAARTPEPKPLPALAAARA